MTHKQDWGDMVRALSDIYAETQNWEKGYRMNDWAYEEDLEDEYGKAVERESHRPSDYKRMLLGVMKHLRETGADTLEVLRDNELNEWWGGEVAKIEAAERKAAAKERAMSVLSPEERKALGLKF